MITRDISKGCSFLLIASHSKDFYAMFTRISRKSHHLCLVAVGSIKLEVSEVFAEIQ